MARPAPDRWRPLATWLGVSMRTLLLAEGLISDEDLDGHEPVTETYVADGSGVDGDFFGHGHALIERSLVRGVVTAHEAESFRQMLERIKVGLDGDHDADS